MLATDVTFSDMTLGLHVIVPRVQFIATYVLAPLAVLVLWRLACRLCVRSGVIEDAS